MAPALALLMPVLFGPPSLFKTRGPFDQDVEAYGAKADGRTFSGDAFNKVV